MQTLNDATKNYPFLQVDSYSQVKYNNCIIFKETTPQLVTARGGRGGL